jgi:hypothetical protein
LVPFFFWWPTAARSSIAHKLIHVQDTDELAPPKAAIRSLQQFKD